MDTRGGATAEIAPKVARMMGATVVDMNSGFSDTFHGCSPEPTRENLGPLIDAVNHERGDIGITFDGDGDRVLFVDENGALVDAEAVAFFLHRSLSPAGKPLVATVDASQRLESLAKVVRSPVGSRSLLKTMERCGARVGFETSSHYILRDHASDSDGALVACVLTDLLASTGKKLSEVQQEFGKLYRTSEALEFASMELAKDGYDRLSRIFSKCARPTIDGFLISRQDGYCLIRRSNTQPLVRMSFESNSEEQLGSIVRFVRNERTKARLARD
jgi:phosphomannomutase